MESSSQYFFYYLVVLFAFIYFVYKNKNQKFLLFIILLFFPGLFSFYSKELQNGYKIALVVFTLYFLAKTNASKIITNKNKWVWVSFCFFSLAYFISTYINDDYFFIIFSQYSRYFIIFSLFIIFSKFKEDQSLKDALEKLIYNLLLLQIILSLVKISILGITESVVGSISSEGGALATSLPMFGFMFIWLKKRGILLKNEWLIIIGFMFIGFVSGKRAIWFIMPILISFFMFYIPKRKIPLNAIIASLVAVPLVFYMGVRFTPDLNKENKIGGKFDMQYAIDYAKFYSFGSKDKDVVGAGRGGATLLLVDKIQNAELTNNDLFGYGLTEMYATDYGEFDKLDFGINQKGSATGVFQTFITSGYIGILATLIFALSLIFQIKNKRLKYVIIGLFCWEYFFYTGIILRDASLSFLLIYIILFYGDVMYPKYKVNQILVT